MANRKTEALFLLPGEIVIAHAPARVKTVVGSCVAIMFRAPQQGMAAIAHCLLPCAGVAAGSLPCGEASRYVDTAVETMLAALAAHGAMPPELQVKVFGGADGIEGGYQVGARNVDAARSALMAHQLSFDACVVGGKRGRLLEFDTETGDVLVKILPRRSSELGGEQ